jgi:acetyl-CoA synthetase (ADP-forming)
LTNEGEIVAKKVVEQLRSIFAAKSVAVIGASNDKNKWGGRLIQRLLIAEYQGNIYPINIKEERVQGLRAYRSVLDVHDTIDIAAIAIPAKQVLQAIRECIQKKIKGAVIVSANFAETGNCGLALQDEMINAAREGGIRIIGPNCQGLWNSTNNLNLVLSHVPPKGPISIVSQSGNFSHVFADLCIDRGYGISKIVSVGNQGDLDVADFIEFLADDPETRAVFVYLEGCKDGRKLFQAAKETTRKKPVIIYKAARNRSVARVAASHTAAIAGDDRVFDAMFKQAGVIRSDDLFGSLGMAVALTKQPLPKGNRIGLMGMGGQGVVTSDICVSMGMEVPQITEEDSKSVLKGIDFPPQASIKNPVDTAGSAIGGLAEAKILNSLARLGYIDGIITNAPALPRPAAGSQVEYEQIVAKVREYLTAIPQKLGKPVIIQCLPGFTIGSEMQEILAEACIPIFPAPEEAARAMYALVRYGEIKRRCNTERTSGEEK